MENNEELYYHIIYKLWTIVHIELVLNSIV